MPMYDDRPQCATQEKRVGPIEEAVNRLERTANALKEATLEVGQKLSGVLTPPCPQSDTPIKAAPKPPQSGLCEALHHTCDTLEETLGTVNTIHARCEL